LATASARAYGQRRTLAPPAVGRRDSVAAAPRGLPGRAGHAEAGGDDDLPLDLVDAAAERAHDRAAVLALKQALEHGTRRVLSQVARRPEHFEQQTGRLLPELGAVHLHGRGLGRVHAALLLFP